MSVSARIRNPAFQAAARGVSLIELMVAMTIGVILMAGAVTVYVKARDTYSTMDTTARLQETAQYALALIESDVRMSGYLGLMSRPELVTNIAGDLTDPAGDAVGLNGCGDNWATDLANSVTGWDQTGGRLWPERQLQPVRGLAGHDRRAGHPPGECRQNSTERRRSPGLCQLSDGHHQPNGGTGFRWR